MASVAGNRGERRIGFARLVPWLAALLLAALAPRASAELLWRGQDLAAKGIHKGAGLPSFGLWIDGAHSSFASQELSKDTPPWTLFAGSYNQFYYADSLRDENGKNVPGRYHLATYLLVERLILLTPLRTARIQHFFEMVPIFVATNFAVGPFAAKTAGFSDIAFGTGLNFPEVYDDGALKIEALLDLDVFVPTGHYHAGGLRNLGSNTYGYLSSNDLIFHFRNIGNGIFFEPSLYFSGQMENGDFKNPLSGDRTHYQLGPGIHPLFKLIYHLNKERTLNAGVEGFFDFQYRDDRMAGSRIRNSAERSHMVGPIVTGLAYGFLLDFSVLREFDMRNRPEGTRFTLIVYRVF